MASVLAPKPTLLASAIAASIVGGSGVDPAVYEYCDTPQQTLAWLGRISPEKALEDAVAAAAQTGMKLKIMGKIQNPDYWAQIQHDYPHAPIEYLGFLPTHELQQASPHL